MTSYKFDGETYDQGDMDRAQRIACHAVSIYGEGDEREAEAVRAGNLWNDHPAVQTALAMIADERKGLGIQVSLIDVFAAWGEREGRDTAMLIDLCLGAAIEQMAEQHKLALPLQIRINAVDLERLANSGRIIRLEAEPNTWTVQLVDATPDATVLTS